MCGHPSIIRNSVVAIKRWTEILLPFMVMKIMEYCWKDLYLTCDLPPAFPLRLVAFPLWEKSKLVQTSKTTTKRNFMTTLDEAYPISDCKLIGDRDVYASTYLWHVYNVVIWYCKWTIIDDVTAICNPAACLQTFANWSSFKPNDPLLIDDLVLKTKKSKSKKQK